MLTIRQALEMDILKDAEVLAGHERLDNLIKWVNLMEILDSFAQLKPGEFVISTGFNFDKGDYKFHHELVKQLSERKLAGLAVQPGYYIETIPDELIQICSLYKFPLIQLPPKITFGQLTRALLNHATNNLINQLETAENFDRKVKRLIQKEGVFQGVVKSLHQYYRLPVRLLDDSYNLIASAGFGNSDIQIHTENLSQEYEAILKAGLLNKLRKQDAEPYIIVNGHKTIPRQILIPLLFENELFGFISISGSVNELKTIDKLPLRQCSYMCLSKISSDRNLFRKKEEIKHDFFSSLLADEDRYSQEEIRNKAQILGLDPDAKLLVVLIFIKNIFNKAFTSGEKTLETLVHNFFVKYKILPFIYKHNDQLMIFIDEKYAQKINKALIQKLYTKILSVLKGMRIYIGSANSPYCLSELKKGVNEARKGIHYLINISEEKRVVFYDDIGIYQLLFELNDNSILNDFYQKTVGKLDKYDGENNTNLTKTLSTFLKFLSYKKTADELYIHRHTLKYRLDRIKELTGKDPCNPEEALILNLGLKIKKQLKIL